MLSPPILPILPHQSIWHNGERATCIAPVGRFKPGDRYIFRRDMKQFTRTMRTDDGRRWKITSTETDAAVWPETGNPMIFSLRTEPLPLLEGFLGVNPMTALHDYFDFPPVPDVSQVFCDRYEAFFDRIDRLDFPFRPKPFQRDHIARLCLLDQALVAWEPGLGKTAIAFLWPMLRGARRTLIICPSSMILQTRRFAKSKFKLDVTGLSSESHPHDKDGFFIASYDSLFQQSNGLLQACVNFEFDAVVLDEAAAIQNPETYAGGGVWFLRPPLRLAMTATPIKNKMESLANLLQWIDPEVNPLTEEQLFRLHKQWVDAYTAKATESGAPRGTRPAQKVFPGNLHHFWSRASSRILRLQKSQTGERMAPLSIEHHMVAPDHIQWHHYQRELAQKHCISTFQRLMGISSGIYDEHGASVTNKLVKVVRLVLANKGRPILIGSTRRYFSALLQQSLSRFGILACIADGSSHPDERARLAARFSEGRVPVLIASLTSMSQGHDFSACPTVILPTLSLAFDDNEQFLHRVWRLNTVNPITVHLVSTSHSVDQRVAEIYLEKRAQTRLVIDGGTDIPEDLLSDLDREEVWDGILALAGSRPELTDPPSNFGS